MRATNGRNQRLCEALLDRGADVNLQTVGSHLREYDPDRVYDSQHMVGYV